MENHPKVQAVRDALDAAGARTADGRAPRIVIFDDGVHTAAAGVPQAVFPITYAELLRVTAGDATDVA